MICSSSSSAAFAGCELQARLLYASIGAGPCIFRAWLHILGGTTLHETFTWARRTRHFHVGPAVPPRSTVQATGHSISPQEIEARTTPSGSPARVLPQRPYFIRLRFHRRAIHSIVHYPILYAFSQLQLTVGICGAAAAGQLPWSITASRPLHILRLSTLKWFTVQSQPRVDLNRARYRFAPAAARHSRTHRFPSRALRVLD